MWKTHGFPGKLRKTRSPRGGCHESMLVYPRVTKLMAMNQLQLAILRNCKCLLVTLSYIIDAAFFQFFRSARPVSENMDNVQDPYKWYTGWC